MIRMRSVCIPHLLQHVSLLYGLQNILLRCLLGFTTQDKLIQYVIRFLKVEDNVQFTHLVFKHTVSLTMSGCKSFIRNLKYTNRSGHWFKGIVSWKFWHYLLKTFQNLTFFYFAQLLFSIQCKLNGQMSFFSSHNAIIRLQKIWNQAIWTCLLCFNGDLLYFLESFSHTALKKHEGQVVILWVNYY